MTSERFHKIIRDIWEQLKPFLQFLLTVAVIMSIATIIMLFVWDFGLNDDAFLILVIADISVLAIFAVGLIFVGVRYVMTDVAKRDDITCRFCGENMKSGSNICLNCGKDNKMVTGKE